MQRRSSQCLTNSYQTNQNLDIQSNWKRFKIGKNVFFRMFQSNKSYWETGTVDKQIGNMIYIINGPRFTHKRHLNQIQSGIRIPSRITIKKTQWVSCLTNDSRTEKILKKTRNNGFNWDKPKKEKILTPYGARLKRRVLWWYTSWRHCMDPPWHYTLWLIR